MARRRWEEKPQAGRRWILTYLDLCTLLFAFFVLLVSMSTIDAARKKTALGSLEKTFGKEVAPAVARTAGDDGGRTAEEGERGKSGVTPGGERGEETPARPEVVTRNDQVVVEIRNGVLFNPGSFVISGQIRPYLTALADHLAATGVEVEINGYTDLAEGGAEGEARRRSWEVSMKRAEAVYAFLKEQGADPGRMKCRGFAHYRPAESTPGAVVASERDARVEVVLAAGASLPAGLQPEGTGTGGPVNYKNFFFRLFPVPAKGPAGPGGSGGHGKKTSSRAG